MKEHTKSAKKEAESAAPSKDEDDLSGLPEDVQETIRAQRAAEKQQAKDNKKKKKKKKKIKLEL